MTDVQGDIFKIKSNEIQFTMIQNGEKLQNDYQDSC